MSRGEVRAVPERKIPSLRVVQSRAKFTPAPFAELLKSTIEIERTRRLFW